MNQVICDPGIDVLVEREEAAFATVGKAPAECRQCDGTGLLPQTIEDRGKKYEVRSPCALRRREARLTLFNRARIPWKHGRSTFENFRPPSPKIDQARQRALEFAMTWPLPQRGFLLAGPVGTGKTHLLAATLRHLTIELGVHAEYVDMSRLYKAIKEGFDQGKSGGQIVKPLCEAQVLAIDELGRGRSSPFELETIDELIARRYNAGRLTLVATNFSLMPPEEHRTQLEETKQRFERDEREKEAASGSYVPRRASFAKGKLTGYRTTQDGFAATRESQFLYERVEERTFSRLLEMCEVIEFDWTSLDKRRAMKDRDVEDSLKLSIRKDR